MITMTLENNEERKKSIRKRTAKPLLWIGMGSIVMFFGGLTSAVIVEYGNGENWFAFQFPVVFRISTVIILLSSITFYRALVCAKRDQAGQLKLFMGLTLFLGIGFMITQYIGWKALTAEGIYFTGPGHYTSASYFYVLTWAHFAHALGGIISLIVVFVKSLRDAYNSKNLLGLQLSSTYWHFLGALWVYLFLFLNFINQNF